MSTVTSLIAAHHHGDRESLKALAVALASAVEPVPALPTDPVELWSAVEDAPPAARGTWQEVVAARDNGDLTDPEFDYLVAATEALTLDLEDA